MGLDFLSRQRSRMATGVGVVVVRAGVAVGIMTAIVGRIMVVTVGMPAAFGRMVVAVHMIQREHTAEEPGDHAEHQEP